MHLLRRYLIAGLLLWLPLGVTILVIRLLVGIMDQTLLLLPKHLRPEALFGFNIPGLGLVLSVLVVLTTGILVANLFGVVCWPCGSVCWRAFHWCDQSTRPSSSCPRPCLPVAGSLFARFC